MPCCRSSSHTHWGLELAYCLPCCAALLEAHAIIRKGSITPHPYTARDEHTDLYASLPVRRKSSIYRRSLQVKRIGNSTNQPR
jgi:hypothetical protein